jgi:hypothetical protein
MALSWDFALSYPRPMEIATRYSDYIFYADESGDHSLTSIDPTYPLFALSLCAFKKRTYCRSIVPRFQALKFKYFGHDTVVLHEHEIRKQTGDFTILVNEGLRHDFMDDLASSLSKSDFKIMATVISKADLNSDLFPENPYVIALKLCLEQAHRFLVGHGQADRETHFIFEKRGAKEDRDLELEFRRFTDGENTSRLKLPNLNIHFSDKRTNSTGMQIADLTARPLGLRILRADQTNRAFELIARKLYRASNLARPSRGVHIPRQ